MPRIRLSAAAQADIVDILAWTQARFGEAARRRYEALIVAALGDLADEPRRPGVLERPELGAGARTWHLRGSRERARDASGIVRRPRHFVVFREGTERTVEVGRVLHDAMDLERHRPSEDWD